MLGEALRYPLRDRTGRDAVAICVGLVLVMLLSLRVADALAPPLARLRFDALTPWLLGLIPLVVGLVPTASFLGYLGHVLTSELTDGDQLSTATRPSESTAVPFSWSFDTVRTGAKLLVVFTVYLLPAAVALVLTALVLVGGGGGMLLTIAPTFALLVTVASAYVLPAALAATALRGVRAGLSRSSLAGLASGSYFFAWTVATALVVSAWSLLAAVASATPAAVLLAVLLAYVHVVAARLLGQGIEKSPRSPWAG